MVNLWSFLPAIGLVRSGSSAHKVKESGPSGFPTYNVKDFGAVGDGTTLNTNAIQLAIDTASQKGGGIVYFPPGDYVTGTIVIRSYVTLYLEAGSTIWGSKKKENYDSTYPHLIYAKDAMNIAIQGRGTINGNGTSFWKMAKSHWVVRGWRPLQILEFFKCQNLTIKDITVRNSPYWTIHTTGCDGINIQGVTILNGVYQDDGVNTDGIGLANSSNVRVSDCYIQAGDDCIVLGTTQNGNPVCSDVTVTNCVLISTEVAFRVLGYTAGVNTLRNITFSNCVIRDAGCGIGCMVDGLGIIDGVVISNVSMTLTNGGQPIFMWIRRREENAPWGAIKNVIISNVTAVADGCIFISGAPEKYLEGITLENIRLFMRGAYVTPYHDDPPYPFLPFVHRQCPYDIMCRWVNGLSFHNVQVTWNTPERPEWGSAMRCWHVNDLNIDGFTGRQSIGSGEPAIMLKDVQGAFIHNCRAPLGTGTFLKMDEQTRNVTLANNDLSQAKKMFELPGGVDAKEFFEAGNRPPGEHQPEIKPATARAILECTEAQIKELRKATAATEEVFSVAFSPDGKTLASGGADYAVKLWDVVTGKKIRTLWGHNEEVFSVAFSPDGKRLASGSDDCTTKLWDLATGEEIWTLGNHEYYVWSVVFSPDGKRLITSNYDTTIILWDIATAKEIKRLFSKTNWLFSLALSPDGKILASGYWDGTKTTKPMDEATLIGLWDMETGKAIRILAGHNKWIWSIAFSPDGKVLASAGEDGTIKLWDVATGEQIHTLTGHTGEVTSVAFSPDGKTLATGSKDKTIKFWNVANGKEISTLLGHTDDVWSVAFSPDSKLLASGSADKTVKLWNVTTGIEMTTLYETVTE